MAFRLAGARRTAALRDSRSIIEPDHTTGRWVSPRRCKIGKASRVCEAITIISTGADAVLSWPTNFRSFSLEMATNLASPTIWRTNATLPVVINGLNVVTNPLSGMQQFYRLSQ
jgi:hypothetical protein